MALNAAAALIGAQYRAAWNRILRTAGLGGAIATWITLGLVAVVLFFPALLMTRIGLDLGYELASSGDAGVLRSWNFLVAAFCPGFALLGGFRAKPSFPASRFGRYPLTRMELLLAELPAATFEVFPMIAIAGMLAMNVGLAFRMPSHAAVVALLGLVAVASIVATMLIASSIYAWLARHRLVLLGLVAIAAGASVSGGLPWLRTVVKEWLPAMVNVLPLSWGYRGLVALHSGDISAGAKGIAFALGAGALLTIVASFVQWNRIMAEGEPEAASSRISAMIPLRSRGASPATAFLIQLFTGRLAIVLFAIPFLYTAPIALTASLGRAAIAEGTVVVEPIGTFMRLAETAPLFALLPLLSIAMNAQVWLNQFGRDRRGLRTFFLLPFEPRELLAGRLRGLLAFTSLQTAIAAVPLLAIRRPGAIELVSGIAAGGVLLLVTTAVGHVVSILHPRAVEADSSTHIPLHLSWIAPATLLGTVAELAGLWFVFDLFVPGAGRAGLVLSLAAAIAAYRAALPRIAELLHSERERLLTM